MTTNISIDFEVYKHLTLLRDKEETSYNDVIRNLLKLDDSDKIKEKKLIGPTVEGFSSKGVFLPNGTQLRGKSHGIWHTAEIKDGGIHVNGKKRASLSAAAYVVTGSSTNGWNFWGCRMPGTAEWVAAGQLRPQSDQD